MIEHLVHPDSHSGFSSQTETHVVFQNGSTLPKYNAIPVLFGNDSIFLAADVLASKPTTQDKQHLDTRNFKNYVRRRLLPDLVKDFNIEKRYKNLAALLPDGSKILVVGTGEKKDYYRNLFAKCKVVTSDVHAAFSPDFIFDGHQIPFKDETFDMVLAAQVIEHVMKPWQFCAELQRVVKNGGLLQIEAPQNYPYHAEPYDFFRYTFTGLRSLFPLCSVVKADITEGNASMVAVSASTWLINTSANRYVRSSWLFITRFLFGWMKYFDRLSPNRRTVSMPKGYAFTFQKDGIQRKAQELLTEFYALKP